MIIIICEGLCASCRRHTLGTKKMIPGLSVATHKEYFVVQIPQIYWNMLVLMGCDFMGLTHGPD